jgi:hypothetical protein
MESQLSTLLNSQAAPALLREAQSSSGSPERDVGVAQGLEKIAASLDSLRLEMQGIRTALEALVAK